MRIIHTSDWHLGQFFFGKTRADEHKQFLNWLLEQVSKHNVDAVIVAGDIFDTGNPPSYAREIYFDFITQLQALSCQLVILAGNHDSTAMIGESKQLLAHLSTHVVPSAALSINEQVFTLPNREKTAAAVICAVPFIRPRDVIESSAGQSAQDKQQQLQQAISTHYQTLYQQAKKLADNRLPIIATGHLTTVGVSTSDSVRDIYIGTLDAFPASQFPPVDYMALGHIHQMQNVAKSAHIRYCGSPIPLSFDEVKQDKVVLLVDVIKDQSPVIEALTIPRFQPMAMVKSSIENVVADIELLLVELPKDVTLWLDIEIDSSNYRSDIQAHITEQLQHYIDEKRIDILLIRRSKNQRETILAEQKNITLEELTPLDVFEARLVEQQWPEDDEYQQKKERLTTLFQTSLENLDNDDTEANKTFTTKTASSAS